MVGTPTASLCVRSRRIIASRLVSPKLPFILSAWYARTKNSILIPHSHHHHGINDRVEKGWGVPLVMGLVPLILRKRGRGFFSLRDHSARESYFSLHLPEVDSAN